MSWKFVLLCLALGLSGHLLIAEARETEEGDARRKGPIVSAFQENFESRQDRNRPILNALQEDAGNRGGSAGPILSALQDFFGNRRKDSHPSDPDPQEDSKLQDVENDDSLADENSNNNNNNNKTDDDNNNVPPVMESVDGSSGWNSGQGLRLAVEESETARLQAQVRHQGSDLNYFDESTGKFLLIVGSATLLAAIALVGAGVCWYKYHKRAKSASVVDYPAYGVTGPTKDHLPSPGDRKLAQSAQMYHYQHQKQQMIAMEKANGSMKHDASDEESEEDNVEGDYTVYECPGLAPTGEMEVKNPLFRGDETPTSTPVNEDPPPPPPPQDK